MFTPSLRPLRRTRDLFLARWGILDWLRLFWSSLVLWCELAQFHFALRSCAWPDPATETHHDSPAHVLLLADPQVRDPSSSRPLNLRAFRQFLTNLALNRSWHFALRSNPDVVIFLGDILAPWKQIRSDVEYDRNLRRFKSIFHLPRSVTAFYVPGNNDVGLNVDPARARQARSRWTAHLGPLNQAVVLRNHTLVMLDAAGLAEEDYRRAAKYGDYEQWSAIPHGAVEFLRTLQDEHQKRPTIVFTHIPLYRPDQATCGPLREKGNIHRGVGPGYQNMLGKKTSAFVLQTLRPSFVFSADDKDYCDYMHVPPAPAGAGDSPQPSNASKPVREITVKTFSPAQGLRHPGFELLSIASPTHPGTPASAATPCFLPDYRSVYTRRYPPLLLLTALALVILRLRKPRATTLPQHHSRGALRMSISLHTLPPTLPWPPAQPSDHPPTPFAPDWSFQTPGFATTPHSPRAISSPTDEIPRTVRTPLSFPAAGGSGGKRGDAGTPTTPTFRAATTTTTHPRDDASTNDGPLGGGLLPRLAVGVGAGAGDGDDGHEHDEFASGRHDPRRLTRAARGYDRAEELAHAEGGEGRAGRAAPPLAFTFSLGGVRRRISVANLLPRWVVRRRPSLRERAAAAGWPRRGRKRAFVRRVGLDLGYIVWPAGVLWVVCAWWLT
ncbi:hypothetical protein BC628DRAFT_1532287 [Trametes gibbosa]|nr:hypothetical protein BC628DRAFT_1532287 [Trametes gibbosa]